MEFMDTLTQEEIAELIIKRIKGAIKSNYQLCDEITDSADLNEVANFLMALSAKMKQIAEEWQTFEKRHKYKRQPKKEKPQDDDYSWMSDVWFRYLGKPPDGL